VQKTRRGGKDVEKKGAPVKKTVGDGERAGTEWEKNAKTPWSKSPEKSHEKTNSSGKNRINAGGGDWLATKGGKRKRSRVDTVGAKKKAS